MAEARLSKEDFLLISDFRLQPLNVLYRYLRGKDVIIKGGPNSATDADWIEAARLWESHGRPQK